MSPSIVNRSLKFPHLTINFIQGKYIGRFSYSCRYYTRIVGTVVSASTQGGERTVSNKLVLHANRNQQRFSNLCIFRALVAEGSRNQMAASREHKGIPSMVGQTDKLSLHDVLASTPSPQEKQRGKKAKSHNMNFPTKNFENYWSRKRVSEALKRGEVMEGIVRINARNYELAYLTPPDESRDILIKGLEARNRALHGDKVVVKILPEDKWEKINNGTEQLVDKEKSNESIHIKTAKVVFISEEKHSRAAAGHLKPFRNHNFGCALFHPMDSKVPRLWVPLNECPDGFELRPDDFSSTLFIARITEWKKTFAFARGRLMKSLGEAGEIEPETEACLAENSIIDEPFSQNVINCLPSDMPWTIPETELQVRKDLRKLCIFSIDPPTARDLDDALSIKRLECGNFEVGVHIADVSYFVQEDTSLDKASKERATSVYLVQRVIPMLPRLLCEELCSLNPGVDRLTFSVVWTMSPDGEILTEWFGRSIIHSCSKLSYNHAQQIIQTDSREMLPHEQFPEIFGGHELTEIADSIHYLWDLAAKLRERRFSNGAVKLDQPKMAFSIDTDSGLPNGCTAYEYKESNMMIEEFMLLANMAVAHKILKGNKDVAILRRHPRPDLKALETLAKLCDQQGIALDISDSKGLHDSLQRLRTNPPKGLDATGILGIISLAAKGMKLAKYFCSGWFENQELYHHYALNVPLYTHFTSPIRRYPDILVHRLLQATLDSSTKVNKSVQEMQSIAEHCNDKKLASKRAQEFSAELFFLVYVRECGPVSDDGYVVGVLDNSFDVISSTFGVVKRVYCNALPLDKDGWAYKIEDGQPQLTLLWNQEKDTEGVNINAKDDVSKEETCRPAVTQVIKHFTKVKVTFRVNKKKLVSVIEQPEDGSNMY